MTCIWVSSSVHLFLKGKFRITIVLDLGNRNSSRKFGEKVGSFSAIEKLTLAGARQVNVLLHGIIDIMPRRYCRFSQSSLSGQTYGERV